MTTKFPLQRKITKKKCPFSLTCVVFVDLLETLVTKITIGCKRHGTDIAFSKILESKDVLVFLRVGNSIFEGRVKHFILCSPMTHNSQIFSLIR